LQLCFRADRDAGCGLAEAALNGNTGVLASYNITAARLLKTMLGNYDNCTAIGSFPQQ